jgi:hypothetical protein
MTQASPKQKALFFALAHDLGYDAATVKERAEQHFGVASFNDLTTQQLSELIDRLLALQARREHTSVLNHTEHSRGAS